MVIEMKQKNGKGGDEFLKICGEDYVSTTDT